MSRFALQAFNLNGTQYGGSTAQEHDAGREVDSEDLDGTTRETSHHEIQTRPAVDIDMRNLGIIAALNGPTSTLADCDFPFKALDGNNGLELFMAKSASDAPGFASGNVHEKIKIARGVIYAPSLSWQLGGKAALRLRCMGRTSVAAAATDPVVRSQVALPAQPVPDFGWTLTTLLSNNEEILAPDSFELSIDPKFNWKYLKGLPYPTDITGAGVNGATQITARISGGDLDLGAGTGTCSAVFTKYAIGGGFAASTLTITLAGQWSQEQSRRSGRGSASSKDLLIRTRWDGTTKPLSMQFGS